MSAALDRLTPEEEAQLAQMRADDAASEPDASTPPQEPAPASQQQQPTHTDDRTIDRRALDEERNRRRKLEADLAAERTKNAADLARVNERLDLLRQAAQAHVEQTQRQPAQIQPPPTPPPDFATDPAGFIQHNFKTIAEQLAAQQKMFDERLSKVEGTGTQLVQQTQQERAIADLRAWGMAQEAEFARENPDYNDAMVHLRNLREAGLRRMGADPGQINNVILTEINQIAHMTRQTGRSFPETLYGLAQDYGWRKPAPGASAANGGAQPGNGAGTGQTADTPANAAERILRGQDMATTLGSTGAAPRGEPGPAHIANMSDEEFARYYADVQKRGGQALRALFGS